jgi:molecular chaperone DnaK (HSP70)
MSYWAMDLGTTNTLIARWNGLLNQPEIIKVNDICRENPININSKLEFPSIIPSSVFVLPHNNLKTRIGMSPFFARHSFIGRQGLIGELAIKENLHLGKPDFVPTFKQQLMYDANQSMARLDKSVFSSKQIAYIFLRELFFNVKKTTGERPDNMVFTTPVDAYETYRFHLKDIAKNLGIKKFKTLDEPVAAAIGYGLGVSGIKRILVFDFGAGTLEVALVEINPGSAETGTCRVIAKEGITLGGNVVDAWILKEFFIRTGFDITDKLDNATMSMWHSILLDEARRIKESLYLKQTESFLINPPEYFRNLNNFMGNDIDEAVKFTRDDLINVMHKNKMYEAIDRILDKTLESSGEQEKTTSGIDEVLVVGGSSLLPEIYPLLEKKFGRDRVRAWQPFEAVVYGAACYAAEKVANDDFIHHNYCFITYDKKTHEPRYNIMVREGTKYPTKKDFWKKFLIPTCSLGEPESMFKLVICEVGNRKNSRSFVWDENGRMLVLDKDTDEQLIIPLNESNPVLGTLNPPHSPEDNNPRLEVSFYINEDRWLCTSVYDLKINKFLMENQPVIRLQ